MAVTNRTWVSNEENFEADTAVTYSSAVAAGDTLSCIVISQDLTDPHTVTDNVNGGTPWTSIIGTDTPSLGVRLQVFRFYNSAAGTPVVTAAGFSGDTQRRLVLISAHSGVPTTSVVDGIATQAAGNGTAPTGGAITTAGAGVIVAVNVDASAGSPTPGGSFISQYTGNYSSGAYQVHVMEWITSAAQTSLQPAYVESRSFWDMTVFAYKAAAADSTAVKTLYHSRNSTWF